MEDTHEKVGNAPEELTIEDRTYELVSFLKEGESSVTGDIMVERAKELNASLGEEEGQYILERQDEIPEELQGKVYLVFPGWRYPANPLFVAYLSWSGYRWYQFWYWPTSFWYGYRWYRGWYWLGRGWGGVDRLLRRRLKASRARDPA